MRQKSPYVRPPRVASAGRVQAIEAMGRNARRMAITLDTGATYEIDRRIFAESVISQGDDLSQADVQRLLDTDDRNAASNSAARILTVRARSTAELKSALLVRGYPPPIVDEVLADFAERGYIDDAEFARRWIAVRTDMAPRGTRLLKRELREKGIAPELIEESVDESGLSDEDTALALAARRLDRMAGLPIETKRRRLVGFLERRGFGWDTIRTVDRALLQGTGTEEDGGESGEPG